MQARFHQKILRKLHVAPYLDLLTGRYGTENDLCKVLWGEDSEADAANHSFLFDESQGVMFTAESAHDHMELWAHLYGIMSACVHVYIWTGNGCDIRVHVYIHCSYKGKSIWCGYMYMAIAACDCCVCGQWLWQSFEFTSSKLHI